MNTTEQIQIQNTSLKTEASGVDFIKLWYNPAILILIICLLLYMLWKSHGQKNNKF